MENCIFCKIVSGEMPAFKIYEDDKILAFLDINPVNFGHTLVIPKEHFEMMVDTPDEMLAYVFKQVNRLMKTIKGAMKADYVALAVTGVDVAHFHVHLIPRYYDDGLASFWPTKQYGDGEMTSTAEKIMHAV
jgi:histidine triad (HIT) family protein